MFTAFQIEMAFFKLYGLMISYTFSKLWSISFLQSTWYVQVFYPGLLQAWGTVREEGLGGLDPGSHVAQFMLGTELHPALDLSFFLPPLIFFSNCSPYNSIRPSFHCAACENRAFSTVLSTASRGADIFARFAIPLFTQYILYLHRIFRCLQAERG